MLAETLIENGTVTGEDLSPRIRSAFPSEANSVIGVVTLAFSTDPVARWMYPDPHPYLKHFPKFIEAFAGNAFKKGTAFWADGFSGAALWLPPDVHPNEEDIISLFTTTTSDEVRQDLFPVFEEMGSYHPEEPHWYLPMIGVDTFRQGNGTGTELMEHALSECDKTDSYAYLESSNPKNIPLYERFGFEVSGIIQAGASPPLFPMLRQKSSRKG
jgi:GNAT superfamily N-acetyltransferase